MSGLLCQVNSLENERGEVPSFSCDSNLRLFRYMRLSTKACNSTGFVQGDTTGPVAAEVPQGGRPGPAASSGSGSGAAEWKEPLGCFARCLALPLLRRPFALGTAFVSSTVPYGNQVTSASTRAAADYVTNQQKGLRCARLLQAPARTAACGSLLLFAGGIASWLFFD